jgi:signal transduction histidine kinase/CheY-like chemotaxis protein
MFDALPAHLCVLDGDGRILAVNAAWRRFAAENGGADCGVNEGGNYFGACGTAVGEEADHAASFAGRLREVIAGRSGHFEMEYPCHSPTEQRWFIASAVPLAGPGSARALVMHEPVTQRKRAEAVEREAQRLGTLGALAGGIAHDFNNVLGSILGNVHLAQASLASGAVPDPALADRLGQVERAALHARDLVRRILAFGRRQPRTPQCRDLRDLAAEAFELLRTNEPAGARTWLDTGDEALWVEVGAGEVQQVLVNLCTNAWRALPRDGGMVRLSLAAVRLDASDAAALGPGAGIGDYACCVVEDNGLGMDATTAGQAFEPFFTTHAADGGTGLGLALVQGAARAMGGGVRLRTAPGLGSRFEVLLPRVPAPLGVPATVPASDPARTSPPGAPAAGPLRVLLVDDDEVMGLTAQALLAARGHEVEFEPRATVALRRLADVPGFDVLVSDQRMPEMSGITLCRTAQGTRPGLPCVLISGFLPEAVREEAKAAGVREVVAKEEAFERLGDAVARAAAASRAQDSRATPGSSQA